MSFDGLMSFIKLACTVGVAAAAVAVAVVMTIPAQASTTPLRHTTVERGMYLKGFDAAVAKAHGYKIVTYANGTSTQGASAYLLDDVEWGHAWDNLYQYEDTIDQVSTGSYVILIDGEECFSAGPYVVLAGLN
jgi:hypothetical protein